MLLSPLMLAGGAVLIVTVPQPQLANTVAAATPYTVTGRAGDPSGKGHGRGMGQNDAFNQAKDGWAAERILGAAYPGATLGVLPPTRVTVRLMAKDGGPLDTYSDAGLTVAGRHAEPGQAVHMSAAPGGAAVVVTQGCGGPVLWQASTDNPWVDPVDQAADRPAAEHLKLCGSNGRYRGSLGVAAEAGAGRVVNAVDVDDYLRGVLPTEMQPNWADKGGAEALRAQAIASRSYAVAEKRYPYAQTCDVQNCQMYGGADKEDQRTDTAVGASRSQVMMRGGQVQHAEYSANAAPRWRKAVTAAQISAAFGVGELQSVEVTGRTKDGAVAGLKVVGADRTVEVSGDEARVKLALESSDFDIAEGTDGPLVAPAPAQAPDPANPLAPPTDLAAAGPDPIEAKYQELGGQGGRLGKPTGDELLLPGQIGKFRMYDNGVIVWTAGLGAKVVDLAAVLQGLPGTGIGSLGSTAAPQAADSPPPRAADSAPPPHGGDPAPPPLQGADPAPPSQGG